VSQGDYLSPAHDFSALVASSFFDSLPTNARHSGMSLLKFICSLYFGRKILCFLLVYY